jgi:hypothetical protein
MSTINNILYENVSTVTEQFSFARLAVYLTFIGTALINLFPARFSPPLLC